MRVLITNIRLNSRSGTEVIVAEVAQELVARGHAVAVYAPVLGPLADTLRGAGVVVSDTIAALNRFQPDLIHGHHSSPYLAAQCLFPDTPALWFCHDALSWHDDPPATPQIVLHVAHGLTTYNRLVYQGGIDPQRIRTLPNAADIQLLDQFSPPHALRKGLIIAKYHDRHTACLVSACEALGMEPVIVGGGAGHLSDNMAEHYAAADLVFGSGKVALEAMAAGRPVLCVDERGVAGLVTSDVFLNWRARNFGGALLRHPLNPAFVAHEIRLFDPADFATLLARHRSEILLSTYVDRLEALYAEALNSPPPGSPPPGNPAEARSRLAAYLERILPSMRPSHASLTEVAFSTLEAENAALKAELAETRLANFHFPAASGLTFGAGQAGRAVLRSGWSDQAKGSPWSTAPTARLVIPAATRWAECKVIKMDGFLFAPLGTPFGGERQVTILANGITKTDKSHRNNSGKDSFYTYFWFRVDQDLIARSVQGDLVMDITVAPFARDMAELPLSRGFQPLKLLGT